LPVAAAVVDQQVHELPEEVGLRGVEELQGAVAVGVEPLQRLIRGQKLVGVSHSDPHEWSRCTTHPKSETQRMAGQAAIRQSTARGGERRFC
jgi:hypothetical protein